MSSDLLEELSASFEIIYLCLVIRSTSWFKRFEWTCCQLLERKCPEIHKNDDCNFKQIKISFKLFKCLQRQRRIKVSMTKKLWIGRKIKTFEEIRGKHCGHLSYRKKKWRSATWPKRYVRTRCVTTMSDFKFMNIISADFSACSNLRIYFNYLLLYPIISIPQLMMKLFRGVGSKG